MDISPICQICKCGWETIDHALCGCPRANQICDTMFKHVDANIPVSNNFPDRIMWLAENMEGEVFERTCITFWSIWNDRNSHNMNVPKMEWQKRCEWIFDYWEEIDTMRKYTFPSTRTAAAVRDEASIQAVEGEHLSTNSGHNFFNLYTDASVRAPLVGSGYGAVLYDTQGQIHAAMEFWDPVTHTPLATEVQAIIHGISLLQRLQISSAMVHLDSIYAIKMIWGQTQISSDVHHWIHQIRSMSAYFETLAFKHVPRDANTCADYLAKEALDQQNSMLWLGNVPLELVSMSASTQCNVSFLGLN